MRANYAGNTSLIDAQIGEILEAVEGRGELDNTIIVFVSDHGEMNGDAGLVYKSNFLDGAVRVPLLVRARYGAGCGVHVACRVVRHRSHAGRTGRWRSRLRSVCALTLSGIKRPQRRT